ncbi:unnamed protein product [Arabis nemorensis]|uniref:Pre-mRNA-splicing factor 38 n=1 Tax=Arabis nemorensis TaxID=586526 RepID=A0A565BPV3_9BRAS|nr:unnamed protein product [Arabis nemorensis]
MANRTDPLAKNIRGTNPQNLVEKIVRTKIYQHTFWKEQCFGLTAETLVDKAMELDHIGGTFGGNRKPTPFLCLILKMLQIQPEKDIVVEFIKNDDYKLDCSYRLIIEKVYSLGFCRYVRILGAFYLRLTGSDVDVYRYLEPLYNDYRKVRQKLSDGRFSLTHVDEVIEELLTKDYSCDIAMPRLKKRWTLEQNDLLEPRKSLSGIADARASCLAFNLMNIGILCGISSHQQLQPASKIETVEILPGFTVLTVYSEKYDGSNSLTIALP